MLGASVYPRVRALVAAHAATNQVTLARLALDREPYVREAVAGIPDAVIQTPRVVTSWQATRRTAYRVAYRARLFGPDGGVMERSQAVTAGFLSTLDVPLRFESK